MLNRIILALNSIKQAGTIEVLLFKLAFKLFLGCESFLLRQEIFIIHKVLNINMFKLLLKYCLIIIEIH